MISIFNIHCSLYICVLLKNKKPVYVPQRCNENELFYPGDHKDDWGNCLNFLMDFLLHNIYICKSIRVHLNEEKKIC